MAKKLVFSGYKFLESCLKDGHSDTRIDGNFSAWATDCEGLTKQEMSPFETCDEWMEEVDDET